MMPDDIVSAVDPIQSAERLLVPRPDEIKGMRGVSSGYHGLNPITSWSTDSTTSLKIITKIIIIIICMLSLN